MRDRTSFWVQTPKSRLSWNAEQKEDDNHDCSGVINVGVFDEMGPARYKSWITEKPQHHTDEEKYENSRFMKRHWTEIFKLLSDHFLHFFLSSNFDCVGSVRRHKFLFHKSFLEHKFQIFQLTYFRNPMKRNWIQSQAKKRLMITPGMLKAIQLAKFNSVVPKVL